MAASADIETMVAAILSSSPYCTRVPWDWAWDHNGRGRQYFCRYARISAWADAIRNLDLFQSYPDPSDFDEELYSRLHELPDGGRIDLEWVRSHVWRGAAKFHVPRERVVRGMQANMFWIVAEDAEGREKRSVVGKRIVPRELPPKVEFYG